MVRIGTELSLSGSFFSLSDALGRFFVKCLGGGRRASAVAQAPDDHGSGAGPWRSSMRSFKRTSRDAFAGWPFTLTRFLVISSLARLRVLKNRAAQSHLSSLNLGFSEWLTGINGVLIEFE
jgi:hypothetical protein